MMVSFRAVSDVEFRVEYFRVSSWLLDHVRVELKSPRLKDRPEASVIHDPDSEPQPERLSTEPGKNHSKNKRLLR